MNVDIPSDRSGDAILFTRWQRIDTAGEGFYNCSDITINPGNGGDSAPPTSPPQDSLPHLEQGSLFIPESMELTTPSVGDTVKYDIHNKRGELHTSFKLNVTENNKNDWDRLLASQVNGYYATNHNGNVFIGAWHEEMNHYMYFKNDLRANYFNSKDARASGTMSIEKNNDDTGSEIQAVITPKTLQSLEKATVNLGDIIVLHPNNSKGSFDNIEWRQVSGPYVETVNNEIEALVVKTAGLEPSKTHTLTFELKVSNNRDTDTSVYSFTVIPADAPTPPEKPENDSAKWNFNDIYVAGDTVSHNGKVWKAQWWTQGEEPGTTGEWGVWR
ncbi:carbohydrate-binding protein [Vibrio mediterranei]|uniref:carbohydrate-binding protein n=1 Tax=Vibrio mediterranei TaxID=689 RepID=UPI0038CE3B1D